MAVAELAAPAGLLLVAALCPRRFADRLQVRHPRRVQVDLDAKPPCHPVDGHLDVHLREPGHDHLAGLRVAVDVQRRILLGQAPQRLIHLVLLALVAWARLRTTRPAPGSASGSISAGLSASDSTSPVPVSLSLATAPIDPGTERVNGRVILALHLQQLADPLLGVRVVVGQVRVGADRAGKDAHQVDLAAERVGDRLEHVGQRVGASHLGHVAGPRRRR